MYLPDRSAAIHIIATEHQARPFVDTYRNGKQIAYHRSIEMNVNVSTDTVTETVYTERKYSEKNTQKH